MVCEEDFEQNLVCVFEGVVHRPTLCCLVSSPISGVDELRGQLESVEKHVAHPGMFSQVPRRLWSPRSLLSHAALITGLLPKPFARLISRIVEIFLARFRHPQAAFTFDANENSLPIKRVELDEGVGFCRVLCDVFQSDSAFKSAPQQLQCAKVAVIARK